MAEPAIVHLNSFSELLNAALSSLNSDLARSERVCPVLKYFDISLCFFAKAVQKSFSASRCLSLNSRIFARALHEPAPAPAQLALPPEPVELPARASHLHPF